MATITVTDLAAKLDTDGRTTRKFLRSVTPAELHPGKGSKWAIEKRDVRSLTSKFTKWNEERNAPKADAEPTACETDEVTDEVEVDEEPTAEDLASLEAELED